MNKTRWEAVYLELCSEVRSTDDVSFRLLWSALGVSGVLLWTIATQPLNSSLAMTLGLAAFGSTFVFAVFRWELRNLQVCQRAIRSIGELERLEDASREYPARFPPLKPARCLGIYFGKSAAEKLIYIALIAFWLSAPLIHVGLSTGNPLLLIWYGIFSAVTIAFLAASLGGGKEQ